MSGHLFTGASRSRPIINLGGASSPTASNQDDLLTRARQQRKQREAERVRAKAAGVIQAFYRGRLAAVRTRDTFRAQFDALLAPHAAPSSSSLPDVVLLASRLLAVFFVQGNKDDVKRAAAWCRTVLKSSGQAGDKTPLLFSLFASGSWASLIQLIGSRVLFRSSVSTFSLPQAPLFLELTKILCDPSSYLKYRAPAGLDSAGVPLLLKVLLHDGDLYGSLRSLFLAISPSNRSHPALPASVAFSILPLKAYPAPPIPTTAKPSSPPPLSLERLSILRSFTLSVLTLPSLLDRLSTKEAGALRTALPFSDILTSLSSPEGGAILLQLDAEGAAHLLANLFCSPPPAVAGAAQQQMRVQTEVKDARSSKAYLEVSAALLEKAGRSVFAEQEKQENKEDKSRGKEKEVEEIVLDSDSEDEDEGAAERSKVQRARAALAPETGDGDTPMVPPPGTSIVLPAPTSFTLPASTLSSLALLHSRSHLSSLLALSSRFPSSTRPSLALFLTTLLALLPPAPRQEALNVVLYSPSSGGLVRELFRGYVRSGKLGRFLANAGGQGEAGAVLAALSDPQYAGGKDDGSEWATFVLVVELYSRALVTMGDDEFHGSSESGGGAGAGGRNPLTLDEVTTLSSMARNVAFALYWLAGEEEGVLEKKVVGMGWTFEEVRGLVTRLLGEVHARDSRRHFTPEGHWHMTSQFDLQSFVQTAVFEDERLSASSTSGPSAASGSGPTPDMDDLSSDEDDFLPTHRMYRQQQQQRRRRPMQQQSALLSKRQMALVSPRLGVLNNIPFVIPFSTRVAIFRQFILSDFQKLGVDSNGFQPRARHRAVVRRTHLAEDAYTHLNGLGADLKKRVEIVFVDEHGMEESGIDGGGLFKELLTSLTKEVFDTNRGLWLSTSSQELYPNPHVYAKDQNQLSWFTFIGRILGAALYRGILVNVRFADFFLVKWLGRQSYLDDLASLDPELYRGLIKLKNYTGNVEEELSLTFAVTEEDFGVSRTIDLIPGGSEIPVTNENRMQYLVLKAHYHLNVQIAPQCRAFFNGLSEIINPRWLRMFNQHELAELVGGTDDAVDVEDLRRNTVYAGWSADENTPAIQAFWDAVRSFSKDERAALVRFVTSCERPPLLGFAQLNPLFAIRKAGDDQERLPTSATCVNLLKLPEYTNPQNLREKLLYAITSGAGFDLS
ncbi:hypothetical protein JCM8547_007279 [Rhodosporidiobolus lusitaniae]